MEFFRPSPAVLALISLQTVFYLPLVILLAGCRAGAARGLARWLAVSSLALAVIGVAAHFGPALLNLYTGPWPQRAALLTKTGGGMALPLVASLPLLVSAVAPGRRWIAVDVLHGLLLCGLVGLWAWTRVF